MSWQRRALNAWMRYGMKPVLQRTSSPELARRSFELLAPLFCPPLPYTRLLPRPAPVPLNLISVGRTRRKQIILFLHGGAYLAGSARAYQGVLSRLSFAAGMEIAVPDYRLLQEAPFPAAFEDALAAWQYLRSTGYAAADILLAGDSAGGGLALALLAALLGEGERPAGLVALSPWCDLTLSGASIEVNRSRDVIIPAGRMKEAVDQYLAGADPSDARASPLFADFPNPPPVLIQAGDTEVLLSDAQRMVQRLEQAGGAVRLSLWRDVPHVWQFMAGQLPEGQAALDEAATFAISAFDGGSAG
ncbi:alpha/beta hydrolase fold domain-containing protein [Leisingera sp. HS039]|uniref:alpha/beta hydrolase fold domain-containing protein n=1 Tax=unclassified Leisingera TaxID=2614906 RepID=UPI001070E3D6|nr:MULTISPECIES: alpha/beta hydrolase fold domain-containing protein [unclassified Leisingera]MBQ4825181.1 alpha/beta hydrolase fold domain-containing protein [Leisingera sp. HS039]QBR35027.1 steryl acetyl hydrolase [Leisingera sp. NJS201]